MQTQLQYYRDRFSEPMVFLNQEAFSGVVELNVSCVSQVTYELLPQFWKVPMLLGVFILGLELKYISQCFPKKDLRKYL